MKFEKIEGSQVKAFFTITRGDFNEALESSFKINNEKVTVKGFRKGKAPKAKYLAMYGEESLYSDALDIAVNEIIFNEVVKSEEFKIVGRPDLDLDYEKLSTEEDLEITLTFDVQPDVVLGAYKGIEVKESNLKVSDDEIKEEINNQLKDKAEVVVKKTQTIKKGDIAIFDFSGSVDGVLFDGGTAENYELKIGSGQFIPGFEDQMIGMKSEEEKDVVVTFPENYQAENLAGKEAVFKVKLHEVKEEKLPKLTDSLVEEFKIENIKTVDEYNSYVVEKLQENKKISEDARIENDILTKVIENSKFDVPKSIIENRQKELMGQYEAQAKQYGIDFELFLQLTGQNLESLQSMTLQRATSDVKLDYILNEIVKVEKIIATSDEVDTFMSEEATRYNSTKENFEKQYGKEVFEYNLNMKNALELIKSSSKQVK